jgi:hypothetical protein
MTDYFGNRYWAEKYWATRYFQGGDQPEGAISATLSGVATVTATLSAEGEASTGSSYAGVSRKRPHRIYKKPKPMPFAIMVAARIEAGATISATVGATLAASATIQGASAVNAAGEVIDIYAREAEFWLIAA